MSRDGYTRSGKVFGVVVQPQTLEETDRLRGDCSRSKWVDRALTMYNGSMKEQLQERGLGSSASATGLVPHSAIQTPRAADKDTTTGGSCR